MNKEIKIIIFFLIIYVSLYFTISAMSYSETSIVNLDQVPSDLFSIYYLPSYDQAKEQLARRIGDNPILWESIRLVIDDQEAYWTGFIYYYSEENDMINAIYGLIEGDDTGIYTYNLWIDDTTELQTYFSEIDKYIKISAATRLWELQYGPCIKWAIDTKCDFFTKYNSSAVLPNNSLFSVKWSFPSEDNIDQDEALHQVHKMINEKYSINVGESKSIVEDVEYFGGQWRISYWIQVMKNDHIDWITIMVFQQDINGVFHQTEGIDPLYMSYFVS